MAERQTSTPRRSGDSGQRRPAPRDNAERRQPPREGAERRQRDSGERRQPPRDGTERRQPPRDGAERQQLPRDGAERRQPPRDSGDRRQSASYDQERRSASARSGGDRDRRSSRRGDVIRCENCGEDYSVTYKRCPFCDERPGRGGISGRRVANTRGGGYGRPASTLKVVTWIGSFLVILAAAFIIYRFIGAPIFGGRNDPNSGSQSSVSSQDPGGSGQSSADRSGAGNISDIPTPVVEGIALSENDLTLEAGASNQLTANLLPAGVSGDVTWSSSDTSTATVDITGLVTNVNTASSTKKVTITATCGDVSAEAVVYCKATAGGGPAPSSGTQGTIINAEKGLNIRSGPGTTYDKVASATNGARVTVLGEENGWYKIIYSGNKTGYVSKDYVSIG